MNRVAFCTFVAAALSAGSAAQAQPLAFGAINGTDDYSERAGVAQCQADGDQDGARHCLLKRSSFGGLPVSNATMTLNADGKARSLDVALDGDSFERAYQLLVGRYGPPTATRASPRWTGFDDGASLAIRRTGASTTVSFDFPVNAAVSRATPTAALPFLLLAGLGLLAGGLAYRAYGARRARPAPAPNMSMRATLERRLREGRDLQF